MKRTQMVKYLYLVTICTKPTFVEFGVLKI